MSITLQDYATGDTNYISKLNSNNDVLEAAIAALQSLTSGAALSGLSITAAYAALFGSAVAVIGDGSYVPTDAGGSPAGNLSVTAGYCFRPSLTAVLSSTSTVTLSFNGQAAATYYVQVDSTGAPTRTTDPTEAVYSVVWTGSAFGAITRLANVVWGAADWIETQSSGGLGGTYTSLDDRLEAIEAAIGAAVTAQAPHTVFAGPSGGSPTNSVPTFRALIGSDLPVMVGDAGSGGTQGAAPAPAAGDAAAGKFLKADGTYAVPTGAASGTVTSVNLTQPAAGITVSGGPVTSSGSITLALANDLAGVEGLSATGLAARTATDTWAARTLTGPAAGISVTNGDGVSGNPTLVLANDLAALEALSSTGFAKRTGTDTWTVAALVQGDLPAQPYDVGGSYAGAPTASLVLARYPFPRSVVFPAGLTNSQGVAGTAATAQTDFDLKKNGSSVGTMRFAAAGSVASFIMASQTTFAAGDILTVVAPASPDATLANVGFSLAGTR